MDFSDALRALKQGQRVQRAGWNGKGMWLAYSPGAAAHYVPALWSTAAQAGLALLGLDVVDVDPYVLLYTAGGTLVPWLCSQSDLLAEDWSVL